MMNHGDTEGTEKYTRLSGYKVGLLLNLNSVVLKDGLRRLVL
jgi:hypothetical protein